MSKLPYTQNRWSEPQNELIWICFGSCTPNMVIFIIIIILPHAWFNLITLSFASHVEIFLLYVIYCEFDQENCQTSIAFPFVFLPHIFCIACYLYSKSYDANIINNNFNIFYLHWNFILTHISLKFYLIWHFLL